MMKLAVNLRRFCRQISSSRILLNDSIETIFASAGCSSTDSFGAVAAPIYLSTTYERDENLELTRGFNYSRLGNPTRNDFEKSMSLIEDAVESFAFASGMQSAVSIVLACPNAHIILPDDLYHGLYTVLLEVFSAWGVSFEKIDMTNTTVVQECLEKVRNDPLKAGRKVIFWMETPSNPKCKVVDISRLSALVRNHFPSEKSLIVVDATWSTPFLLKPITMGVDIVVHSTTKYISGHSDSLGGCASLGNTDGAQAIREKFRIIHQVGGGVMSPFDAWLAMRGLRTLHVRMKQHCENAMILAEYLAGHKRVQKVHYPGLVSHPQNKLAAAQMNGLYGGMLSFEVKGSEANAEKNALHVVRNVRLFRKATSLGGTESLIEHRATVEGKYGLSPKSLLRVSVGLENVGDLLTDLDIALNSITE